MIPPRISVRAATVAAVALLAACSDTVPLKNIPVNVPKTARIGSTHARCFIDTIKVPYRRNQRLGETRSLAGDFWSRINSSGDLATWAGNEWRTFLSRHGHTSVTRIRDAEYAVTCDIIEINVDKKYDWIWDDDFSASVKMMVKIVERTTSKTVFNRTIRGDHFVQRRGQYADKTDEDLLLLCASSAFQKALEQITFGPRAR